MNLDEVVGEIIEGRGSRMIPQPAEEQSSPLPNAGELNCF